MKIFTFIYKSIVLMVALSYPLMGNAQSDTAKPTQRIPTDTSRQKLNMDAVYNRPFLTAGKLPVAVGGYLEANTQFASTDGISDGFSFQARRFTLFMSSTISKKIKFLSEIEFEDGTKGINIEFAAVDMEFHPLLNFRGGIVMNPIGAFNQNHDGPRWDFIDRPIPATTIIPSTLSNAGFGLFGKCFRYNWVVGYETYLTNGMNDRIISNSENRTSLAAGKADPDRFVINNSGLPMFTGKIAIRHRKTGEIGLSFMNGVYNRWQEAAIVIDNKRSLSVFAVDMNTSLAKNRITLTGEFDKVWVDVPDTYSQTFGSKQSGAYLDIVATVIQRRINGWDKAKVNFALRLEYADYNEGRFRETDQNIYDHTWSIVPGIAFRPAGSTVLRFNYRHQSSTDLLGNPPSKTGAIQFGISSYF